LEVLYEITSIKKGLLLLICTVLLSCSKADASAVRVGDTFPAGVHYTNVDGTKINFSKLTNGQKRVLVYYRGGWCPYCNKQLAALQNIEQEIRKKGYQIYALSADSPESFKETAVMNKLGYILLSDSSMKGADALGISYVLPEEKVKKLKSYGKDLEVASGHTHHKLPHPSVFILNEKGIVQFVYTNKDHKVRLSNDKLLKQLI